MRRFPARRSRRSATTSSPTARRRSTASRCCRSCRSTKPGRGLAGDDEDIHARFLEGVVTLKHGVLRIACLYLPNGNPPETEKYPYKLKWMSRLLEYSKQRLKAEEPLVLAGDFNVIPAAEDVHNPAAWVNDALFRPAHPRELSVPARFGLTDALRAVTDAPGQYTFWDYQAGAWQKNQGLRIDHLLLSPQASDRLIDVGIDSYVRGLGKTVRSCPGLGRPRSRDGVAAPDSRRRVSPCGPAPSARASAAPSHGRRRRPWRWPCCSFP